MFSTDGTRVVARSSDGTDFGWDAASGIQLSDVSFDHISNTSSPVSPRTIEVNSDYCHNLPEISIISSASNLLYVGLAAHACIFRYII
jgi:hypothetical protein